MIDQEQEKLIKQHLENKQKAMREFAKANQHLMEDISAGFDVKGQVDFTGAFLYTKLHGYFNMDSGKTLSISSDLWGIAVAGGVSWGLASFFVSLDELLSGSVAIVARFEGSIGSLCAVDFSRNLKQLGTFIGGGIGMYGGTAGGSGRFKLE